MPQKRPAVLVVDDDISFLIFFAFSLDTVGFTVYEASNADEAISILNRHSEILLMFTDIDMPGSMDGLKLSYSNLPRYCHFSSCINPVFEMLGRDDRSGLKSVCG
jgi:DNA-binding NtrC family response regulator